MSKWFMRMLINQRKILDCFLKKHPSISSIINEGIIIPKIAEDKYLR